MRLGAAVVLVFAIGLAIGRASASAPEAAATVPTWTVAGALSEARNYPRVVTLPNGELFVTGGVDPAYLDVARATSELFDPSTGRSTVLAAAGPGRVNHTATLAWGDRVVVIGGTEYYGGSWHAMDRVDVYLSYSHVWLRGASMPDARADHAAVALRDGRVLVAGGENGNFIYRSAQIYDPSTDRWTAAAPMPRVRTQFLMTALPDGSVALVGGLPDSPSRVGFAPTAGAERWDPRTNTWSELPAIAAGRALGSLVVSGGDVYLVGAPLLAEEADPQIERLRLQ